LEDIIHMVRSTVSEGHKILIFSQFVRHLAIVRDFLEEENIRYAYLDGSTSDRQAEVEAFQKDPNIRVFLISLKAGGVGLNLTAADYVFLLDPWWNPAVEAQAIDRAHRIGQENKVIIYKFITRNTVEEKIMLLQSKKMALAGELIGTEESLMKNLNREDISALLD
jgi:SNF2 family DNA or RNA helicase